MDQFIPNFIWNISEYESLVSKVSGQQQRTNSYEYHASYIRCYGVCIWHIHIFFYISHQYITYHSEYNTNFIQMYCRGNNGKCLNMFTAGTTISCGPFWSAVGWIWRWETQADEGMITIQVYPTPPQPSAALSLLLHDLLLWLYPSYSFCCFVIIVWESWGSQRTT